MCALRGPVVCEHRGCWRGQAHHRHHCHSIEATGTALDHHEPPPAQVSFALDGNSGSITAAHRRAEEFLGQLLPPLPADVVQDAMLLVSELVTNAVRHAPGPCAVDLLRQDHLLVIAVTDTSTRVPLQRPADLVGGTGGLGMHLLHRLAQSLTVRIDPGGNRSFQNDVRRRRRQMRLQASSRSPWWRSARIS
jgi:anti-sigma regulatory factor (Ser/Thr protein kinase)